MKSFALDIDNPWLVKNMSPEAVQDELERGGRLVRFPYCVSVIFATYHHYSDVYLIRKGEFAIAKGWPFFFTTFFLGWWGIPMGLILTPLCLLHILIGGEGVAEKALNPPEPEVPKSDLKMPLPFGRAEIPTTTTPEGEPTSPPTKNPWEM